MTHNYLLTKRNYSFWTNNCATTFVKTFCMQRRIVHEYILSAYFSYIFCHILIFRAKLPNNYFPQSFLLTGIHSFNLQVCPTYPHAVFVPKSVEDETIIKAASFRQGGRFPVLSYYHKDSKVISGPCLLRLLYCLVASDISLVNIIQKFEKKKSLLI